MQTHHLIARRTARYATLGPRAGTARELWIVCHGFGQLAERFLGQFADLDDGTRLIAAPEALSRFYFGATPDGRHAEAVGATWMTRVEREAEIADYVAYLDCLLETLQSAHWAGSGVLRVLGFSQGGATAVRWVSRSEVRVSHLMVWGSPLPPEIDPAALVVRLGGARLSLVAGQRDPVVPGSLLDEQAAAIVAAGGRCEVIRFEGGHGLDPVVLRQVSAAPVS